MHRSVKAFSLGLFLLGAATVSLGTTGTFSINNKSSAYIYILETMTNIQGEYVNPETVGKAPPGGPSTGKQKTFTFDVSDVTGIRIVSSDGQICYGPSLYSSLQSKSVTCSPVGMFGCNCQ